MSMSILARFKTIMSSNINAMLDKMEDPSKMIDQLLRDLNDDLGKVRSETAGVMAEEQRAKRALDECGEEISKYQAYAEKAVLAGNDADARQFLTKKTHLTGQYASLQQAYQLAADNAAKMRQMHDKLVSQIGDLNSRRDSIKAKIAVAQTQEKINRMGESMSGVQSGLSDFARMEEKANRMLDEANARAELARGDTTMEDLTAKYDGAPASEVEDELAALKAKLGK